jgi:hypothetical protein
LERISNKYSAKDVQETKDMLENIKESDFEDL